MNFKTLLLGSAAAMIMAGGAQAADLTVAEPVDYVKVCDAFGTGFFYSPGTDTCIKVGGYLKFGTSFGDRSGAPFVGTFNNIYTNSNWGNFYTEASIQLTASSVTEYGNLTGFIDYRAKTGNVRGTGDVTDYINSATNSAYVDSAYLELGPLKAGYFTSLFDFGRGYNDTGMFGSDSTTDHIQLTYAVNGFGLAVSVEDARDRNAFGQVNGPLDPNFPLIDNYSGGQDNIPDIVGAVTYASGIFSAKVAAAWTHQAVSIDYSRAGTPADPFTIDAKDGWAVGGGLEIALDNFSAGDRFFVSAAYGDNANSYTGLAGGTSVSGFVGPVLSYDFASAPGTSWSALASYKHVWTPQLWSSLSGGYANFSGRDELDGGDVDAWRAGFTTAYTPVKGLDIVGDVFYTDVKVKNDNPNLGNPSANVPVGDRDGSGWTFNLFLKRSW
ncbi:outer membrane protein [Kaistia sp. 32K]|uniref:porin n=1 Tax=Kaistia sp. 32K TaxID=2795690 RepID=UPI0019167DC3|nr:porin [Kaistia sp. 32K]BCP52891.1 outer membrane protein [Kaistia sp. 32K]